ncbi:hypothetical protein AWB74_07152 [Caballeronia arvi]|uniref:Uncharacterized protein n=1 Tax=Caballeronia arvi TaxID=1777135 RepID=A0A158KVS5_9BURK|nr:hypothetical protein AWB74_07152 [Caballeronia arvi]
MLPLLSFHALAAHPGDGLRPELLVLLTRQTGSETSLSVSFDPDASADALLDDTSERPIGAESSTASKP